MSTDRREFLQRLALGGAALGALPGVLHASTPAPSAPTAAFDEFRDYALSYGNEGTQPPAAPAFDTTWTAKLTGKYRAVFDTPAIAGGAGVWRAGMWLNHTKDLLKADAADINPVIVIRHEGIPLIMNNEFWEAYDIGKENKVHDFNDKKTKHNPVLATVEEDKIPASFAAMALHKQIERGVIVLGCNAAFGGMVSMVAKKEKLKFAEARTKALTMMVPGVILQPNGIFGVALAQHNGCAFVAAT